MIKKDDIRNCYNNFGVGEKVQCLKPGVGDKWIPVEAEIIGKYTNYALVKHNNTRWCVKWIDLINNK